MSNHSDSKKILEPSSPTFQNTYCVAKCQQLGRYLVADRDLRRGEIIFQEYPIAAAPQKNSSLICPGCFNPPCIECPDCGWPICSRDCPHLERHKIECQRLVTINQNNATRSSQDWISLQDTLMLYRCLSLKWRHKEKWDGLLEMESNWSSWAKSPLFATAEETVQCVRDQYEISEEHHSTSEILQVLAIFDINAYEVKMPEVNVQGCYQLASLAEHSCVPNAFKATSSSTLLLTMRALSDIPKGSHIATTYCDVLLPTSQRQRHIQWSKFFVCHCLRCTDSTELGSYISSFICPNCPVHTISPLTPILLQQTDIIKEDEEEEGMWTTTRKDYQCQNCGSVFPASRCESFLITAEQKLQELDTKCSTENKNIVDFESWLEHWTLYPAAKNPVTVNSDYSTNITKVSTTITNALSSSDRKRDKIKYSPSSLVYLHPQHALSLDACHTAFLLYSSTSESLCMDELTRKNSLGMHLLHATTSIFGGISMFRGTIMYELAMTKAAIFARCIEPKPDNATTDLKPLAKEILSLLTESLENLQYESEDQPEGRLFTLGLRQLEEFKTFLKEIVPDL